MNKEQIQKIVDFYSNHGIVQYFIDNGEYSGYIDVAIKNRNNKPIYISKNVLVLIWDYLKDCKFKDFRFLHETNI